MHPELSAVMVSSVGASAKLLYSVLYANTNGVLTGTLPVADVLAHVGVSGPTLRRLRAELKPWAWTAERNGVLRFDLRAVAREACAQEHTLRAEEHTGPEPADDVPPAADAPRAETREARAQEHTLRATARTFPPTPPEEEELINLTPERATPPPHSPTAPDGETPAVLTAEERERTWKLLTDGEIAMSWSRARECAAAHPFGHCLAHALAWLADRRAGQRINAGALAVRIQTWPTPALPAGWRHGELAQRHGERESGGAGERESAVPEAEAEVEDPPGPTPDTVAVALLPDGRSLAEVWAAAQDQLRLQMTKSTYDTWVRDTEATAWGAGWIAVRVANAYARDWLALRLRPMVIKAMASIVGQPMDVTFWCRETANERQACAGDGRL